MGYRRNEPDSIEYVTLGDVWRHTSRFFTRLPISLLGTWAVLTAGLIGLVAWQNGVMPTAIDLLVGDFAANSTTEFLLLLLAAQAVAMLRTGLLLPARLAYDGADLSWKAVLRMAAGRFLPVLELNIKLGFGLAVVGLICVALDVSMTMWVILPISFMLQPAHYYVTAHQMSATRALRTTLSVARRHWMPIFLVFGGLTCLSAALPSLVDSCSQMVGNSGAIADVAEQLGRSTVYLAVEFIGFLFSCGLYFALDGARQ